jgi:hypothetical protein
MNAIELYRPGRVAGTFRYATAEVLADVRLDGVDRRLHSATYELVIASRNGQPLCARLMGVSNKGSSTRELGSIEVTPESGARARIVVPLPRRAGNLERVYLQLEGDNLLFIGEAPAPTLQRRSFAAVGGTLVGCGILSVLAAGATLLIPRTPAVASPASIVSGTVTHIGYATEGYGKRDYRVWMSDGTVLASAVLPESRGDFTFVAPRSKGRASLHVRVRLIGPLGEREREVTLPVVAGPVAAAEKVARVVSLSAQRGQDAFGRDSVVVSYLAVGDGGSVDLLDSRGRIVASAPFAHIGTNRIVVADGLAAQPLVARIVVRRDLSRATAAVDVPPSTLIGQSREPSAQRGPVTPANPPSDAQAPEAVTPLESPGDGLVAIEGRAVAGHNLSLRILARLRSVHVELQDDQGQSLAESDVAPGSDRVALPLPLAAARRTYYLVLRYVDAHDGEETIVRSVVAQPA